MNNIMDAPFPSISHPYAHAQHQNERAARYAEVGQYDKAISALTNALTRWKKCQTEDITARDCLCCQCDPNEMVPSSLTNFMDIDTTNRTTDASWADRPRSPQDTENEMTDSPVGCKYGYIHHKLMRIPCRKMFHNHNVGSAVALIIIFNLAIVHHLNASRSNSRPRIEKTLKLYELANHCLNTYVSDTHGCCCDAIVDETGILFHMVILNNLSHLHSLLGNHSTSQQCREQLVPLLMWLVDEKSRNVEFQSCVSIGQICLEGFFRSISSLVLKSQCADAA